MKPRRAERVSFSRKGSSRKRAAPALQRSEIGRGSGACARASVARTNSAYVSAAVFDIRHSFFGELVIADRSLSGTDALLSCVVAPCGRPGETEPRHRGGQGTGGVISR